MEGLIQSCEQMEEFILEMGFVPLFKNHIYGFSIEEHCDPRLWFSDKEEGPWEWKGPIARNKKCIYGKFFNQKAGFISLDWAKDFINYRRDGYDFDARFDDGLSTYGDKEIYECIEKYKQILSKGVKRKCNYGSDGKKGFDTIITRLQMQTYIIVSDFEYEISKKGEQYGWGVAKYSTPEVILGKKFVHDAYRRNSEKSKERILTYLKEHYPGYTEKQYMKIVG